MKLSNKAALPAGFQASAVASGVKKSGKLDLALFYSEVPVKAACLFTVNKIQAAPIKINQAHLKKNKEFKAVIVNSGNANAFTGSVGIRDADNLIRSVAAGLAIKKEEVLAASTGIIGRRLAVSKIQKALPGLIKGLSRRGIAGAKKAIMTTDTFAKEAATEFRIGRAKVSIAGIAKGAGMIAPDVATMLVFIFTDANITQGALKQGLKKAAECSFNCITVDGCMSTNDSVMALANGAAGNALIDSGGNFKVFSRALQAVCIGLAELIVRDAEGASKFIRIKVSGARSFGEAKRAGLAVANSNLFKAAMYGEDPNFGRITAAVGASGIEIKEESLKIKLSPLNKKELYIDISLGRGNSSATIYTADLTPEYVKINAEYN